MRRIVHTVTGCSCYAIFAVLAITFTGLTARGGEAASGTVYHVESVSAPVTPSSFDGDIRDLPPPPAWHPGDPIREIPRRFYPDASQALAHAPPWLQADPDPLVARQAAVRAPDSVTAFGTPIINVAGNPNQPLSPPDVAGDVGTNHFIQATNTSGGSLVQIYNKATGAKIGGGFTMVSLGGTGSCASTFGDPIIVFDRLADRWFLLEFTNGGTGLCVHVSKTADPVAGGWWNYTFNQATFPDYPHCSVWWDGYYCTANEGNPPVYAFDRAKMLTGAAATQQTFRTTSLAGYGFQALTPVDFMGATAPPAGAQFMMVRHDDDEAHAGGGADGTKDFIDIFSMHTDWVTPANSTFTVLPKINIAEFNSWFLDYSTFDTVPQPGSTAKLDPIREVILNRSNYRRFATYEAIVGTFATNIDPARTGSVVKSGVRWFELRRSPVGTGPWTLYQEGTYGDSSGTHHALEGTIAMDQSGNIALGFNVTQTVAPNIFASIKYSGRLATDPLGTMTQGENTVIAGAGVESSGRWGDYGSMGVDPVDDCTFWITHEYRPASSWATQIASFKFTQCGCVAAPPALSGVGATAPQANRITVTWPDSSTAAVTQYFIFRATVSGGPYTQLTTVADSSPGTAGGAGYSYNDNTVSGGITYYYVIQANDGAACTSANSNQASATATGTCTLTPTFAGAAGAVSNGTATCGITVSWAAGASSCGGGVTYSVYRSTTSGFTPSAANRIALGVAGTSYSDSGSLVSGTPYYYVVRASDSQGNGELNLVQRSAAPTGAGGGTTTYTSTDVPKAIPDNSPAGVSSNLTIAGNANTVTDVNLTLNATHTYDGDLAFTLTSPAAVTVPLSTNRGGSGDNFTNTVFDDSAATTIASGAPPFTGAFRPESPLAAVNAIPANGAWVLKAVDNANVDTGSITGWSLAVTTASSCTTACSATPFSSNVTSGKASTNVVHNWGAVAGAVTYNVYRNVSPDTATWGAALAAGIAGLTYTDAGQLGNTTSQFYSVTDVNSCGAESPK